MASHRYSVFFRSRAVNLSWTCRHSGHIRPYLKEPWACCTSINSDLPNSSQSTFGYDMEVCVTLKKPALALIPPSQSLFLMVETCSPVACWRSFCRSLVILLLFWWSPAALSSSSRVIEGLLVSPTHLWECAGRHINLIGTTCMDISSWRSWAVCATWKACRYHLMLVVVKRTRTEHKTVEQSVREGMWPPHTQPFPVWGLFASFSLCHLFHFIWNDSDVSCVVSGQIELLSWSDFFEQFFCIQSGWNVNDAVLPHTLMTSQLGDVWMWLCLRHWHCRGGLFSRSECGTICLFICVPFQTKRVQWLGFICSLKKQHCVLPFETC